MAPVNTEPECWNCRHFVRGDKKICSLHQVILPVENGPHLICMRWEHESDPAHAITWWRRKFLTDNGMLYRYLLFSSESPLPLAPFRKLEPVS